LSSGNTHAFHLKLHNAKVSGEPLSLEEEKMMVQLKHGLEKLQDYFILSQEARMNRMLVAVNKQYQHLKKLAAQGDKAAEKQYLELKKLRDEKLKKENEHRTN